MRPPFPVLAFLMCFTILLFTRFAGIFRGFCPFIKIIDEIEMILAVK